MSEVIEILDSDEEDEQQVSSTVNMPPIVPISSKTNAVGVAPVRSYKIPVIPTGSVVVSPTTASLPVNLIWNGKEFVLQPRTRDRNAVSSAVAQQIGSQTANFETIVSGTIVNQNTSSGLLIKSVTGGALFPYSSAGLAVSTNTISGTQISTHKTNANGQLYAKNITSVTTTVQHDCGAKIYAQRSSSVASGIRTTADGKIFTHQSKTVATDIKSQSGAQIISQRSASVAASVKAVSSNAAGKIIAKQYATAATAIKAGTGDALVIKPSTSIGSDMISSTTGNIGQASTSPNIDATAGMMFGSNGNIIAKPITNSAAGSIAATKGNLIIKPIIDANGNLFVKPVASTTGTTSVVQQPSTSVAASMLANNAGYYIAQQNGSSTAVLKAGAVARYIGRTAAGGAKINPIVTTSAQRAIVGLKTSATGKMYMQPSSTVTTGTKASDVTHVIAQKRIILAPYTATSAAQLAQLAQPEPMQIDTVVDELTTAKKAVRYAKPGNKYVIRKAAKTKASSTVTNATNNEASMEKDVAVVAAVPAAVAAPAPAPAPASAPVTVSVPVSIPLPLAKAVPILAPALAAEAAKPNVAPKAASTAEANAETTAAQKPKAKRRPRKSQLIPVSKDDEMEFISIKNDEAYKPNEAVLKEIKARGIIKVKEQPTSAAKAYLKVAPVPNAKALQRFNYSPTEMQRLNTVFKEFIDREDVALNLREVATERTRINHMLKVFKMQPIKFKLYSNENDIKNQMEARLRAANMDIIGFEEVCDELDFIKADFPDVA